MSMEPHGPHKRHQQSEQIFELWQRFRGDGGPIAEAALNNIDLQSSAMASQQPHQQYNSNNNYINFNQFIMQHNLCGGAGTNGTELCFGDGQFFNSDPIAYDLYAPTEASLLNPGNSSSNSQLFPYNGDGGSRGSRNDLCINNANEYLYDNVYNPFGTTPEASNGTPTYFTNPFATGFDFNAVTSPLSNLQATAPEFVPRFNNLSLNDGLQSRNQSKDVNLIRRDESLEITKDNNKPDTESYAHGDSKLVPGASAAVVSRPTSSSSGIDTSVTNSSDILSTTNIADDNQNNILRGSLNGPPSRNLETISEKFPSREKEQRGDRERDRRYTNGRRSMDFHEREDRYERNERAVERCSGHSIYRGNNQRDRDRYDNHRSNKRRDDWNRNRDRINGFRVDERYSSDNGKDSPLPSPEKRSPKKTYPENEKLSQREKLIRDIETRRLECPVCVELIKTHHSVWSCHNCYHILHLQCIIKWASSSKSDAGWRCPACQNVVKDVPRDYYCFCGKQKNPQYTRQDIAHSCGEVCGRIEGCPHACTLLCHPGPCPPCQANVKRECGCGRTTKIMQCCLKESIECDAICSKLLSCELHTCSEKCHTGKCPPCAEKVDQKCHCTKQQRQVACTRDSHDKHNYSCGKICGRDLSCGDHKCKDCCHSGECKPCKLSPEMVTSCPCGKMPVVKSQRTSCLDPIPVCEGICGKTLRCGKAANPHHCTSKCHLGNCPPCNKQTAVKCRCGHMDQMIKCRQLSTRADDARCKKRCVKKRSCGKHKCNQECCIDIDHICPLPCNYTLSCGKHKCDQTCHRGNCPPCYRSSFEELYCECGAEVIYPPVPCGTKRPICKKPCSRAHPCDHAPQHNCHSAANCPPCMIFTTKWCFGHHEQRKTIPCSQHSFSCGLPCQKPLSCGRHKCVRSCHEGPCQQPPYDICKQSCTTPRSTCGHKCLAPCHEGSCPESPCKEMVEVQCECGNRKQHRFCHDLAREYSRIATAQLASSMAEMQRGNYMELSEILAPVKMNKTNKTLDCNDECRLIERNRRLAIGLQIRNPDISQKLMTKYSDFIRNFAKRDPALVKSIYEALTTLVKLAKESKQKSRSHSFPTMNREKRQLVHEMCEAFGVDSVAYDAEPNRNVVATAHKDRSWLPATSIMEIIQREAGQRRVPVPSNNAWGTKR